MTTGESGGEHKQQNDANVLVHVGNKKELYWWVDSLLKCFCGLSNPFCNFFASAEKKKAKKNNTKRTKKITDIMTYCNTYIGLN